MLEKKESVKSPAKQWYNPQFFKLKLLLLCLGLCFIAFVLWVENLTPDLTSLPGVWKSETGQIMAVSGKRNQNIFKIISTIRIDKINIQ